MTADSSVKQNSKAKNRIGGGNKKCLFFAIQDEGLGIDNIDARLFVGQCLEN